MGSGRPQRHPRAHAGFKVAAGAPPASSRLPLGLFAPPRLSDPGSVGLPAPTPHPWHYRKLERARRAVLFGERGRGVCSEEWATEETVGEGTEAVPQQCSVLADSLRPQRFRACLSHLPPFHRHELDSTVRVQRVGIRPLTRSTRLLSSGFLHFRVCLGRVRERGPDHKHVRI